MQCSKCRNAAIIFQPYSGQHLCRDHFILDFETKAKRVIRKHHWMLPQESIAVVVNGDPADTALLFFFRKLTAHRRDIRISAVPAGEVSGMLSAPHRSGVTKIALSTPLETAAAAALTYILQGNAERLFAAGCTADGEIPFITPFCHIPAGEIALYARIHGLEGGECASPPVNDTLHTEVKNMLVDYAIRHPTAPHAVLNLEELLKHAGTAPWEGEKRGA